MFTSEVSTKLGYYVYRLIDPTNGETFYVGKGKGNRVFAHASGEIDEDAVSEKLKRIYDIRNRHLEVQHVIHRHGMDEATAFEVEAALIDAYPSATNIVAGHSSDRGVARAEEIRRRYEAKPADIIHPVVEINISRTISEKPIYDAVRLAWKISPSKASKAAYVFAVERGIVVGVFEADGWYPRMIPFLGRSRGRRGLAAMASSVTMRQSRFESATFTIQCHRRLKGRRIQSVTTTSNYWSR